MSDEDKQFELGVAFVQNSKGVKLDTTTQLRFYALYKIATAGKCNVAAPSRLKVVEYQKWSAWNKVSKEGVEKTNAKKLYLEELNKKVPSWNQAKL